MAINQPNLLITDEDIEVNPELWVQKASVILFNDTSGKNYWNKNYTFIPHHKRFNEAVKWIRDTNFPEYSCRITKNENNEIEIVTQNLFGDRRVFDDKEREIVGKIRVKIHQEINNVDDRTYQRELERGLRLTNYEDFCNFPYSSIFLKELEELKRIDKKKKRNADKNYFSYDFARPDLAILWRKQIYFVREWQYINNYKLYVKIWARKDLLGMYYWNWMRSAGLGHLEKGPVVKDPDFRKHFPFCSDLGNKKIYHAPFKSYQPKLAIFRAHSLGKESMNMSKRGAGGGMLNGTPLPCEIALERFSLAGVKDPSGLHRLVSTISSFATGPLNALRKLAREITSGEVFLTIGCEEQERKLPSLGIASVKSTFFKEEISGEEILFEQNPEVVRWLKEQPHLWSHVTFHFYFLQELVLPANALYLGIKEKDGKFVLPWKLFLTSGPGSVNYRFEFAHLGAIYKISSSETFYPFFNVFSIIKSFKVEAATFGAGASWKEDTMSEFIKKIEKKNKKQGKFEKKAARDKKAAEKAAEASRLVNNADPDASSSMNYHYSFTDLFHHLTKESFFYRTYISETLFNNLKWANNKEGEVNLPIQWEDYKSFSQKVGLWQWRDIYLENDIDNFFTRIMEKGYYLTSGEKLTNPNFGYEKIGNYSKISGNAFDVYFAEEERIEKREEKEEKVADGQTGDVGYAHTTFLRPTNQSQMNLWLSQLKPQTPDPSSWYGWCWGCFSHQINTHGGHGTEMKVDGFFEPTEDTDIEFFMKKNNRVERQVASCQAGVKYEAILKRTGTTIDVYFKSLKITYETTFKEAKKTPSQELDDKELETEEIENENFKEEELGEVEQENGEQGIGAGLEKEREKEDEKEQEEEKEQEGEKEDETEEEKIEKESESEKEQEREREREKEKQELEFLLTKENELNSEEQQRLKQLKEKYPELYQELSEKIEKEQEDEGENEEEL